MFRHYSKENIYSKNVIWFITFYIYLFYVSSRVCICTMHLLGVHRGQQRALGGAMGDCEPPCTCWELYLRPLEEHVHWPNSLSPLKRNFTNLNVRNMLLFFLSSFVCVFVLFWFSVWDKILLHYRLKLILQIKLALNPDTCLLLLP